VRNHVCTEASSHARRSKRYAAEVLRLTARSLDLTVKVTDLTVEGIRPHDRPKPCGVGFQPTSRLTGLKPAPLCFASSSETSYLLRGFAV
jgi:hypothetical protein